MVYLAILLHFIMTDKLKNNNWFKLFYQFAILALLLYMGIRLIFDKVYAPDFEAYCPFGGLQALGSYFTRDSLACAMTSMQIMMGAALFIGVVLFSKLFCGYICPLGTISEWIGKLGSKLKIRFNMPRIPDLILRSLKYIRLSQVSSSAKSLIPIMLSLPGSIQMS
jgi:hypothetical protein